MFLTTHQPSGEIMRLRGKKPTPASHREVIDAIVETTLLIAKGYKTGQQVVVDLAKLPAHIAAAVTDYDKVAASARLREVHKIVSESIAGSVLFFRKQ